MNLKKIPFLLGLLAVLISFNSCASPETREKEEDITENLSQEVDLNKFERAYFASGCFWCVEAIFESVIGVEEAISGYTGGNEENPSYQNVSAGATGHAEAVEVYYDPEIIDYKTLVKVYYGSHNPITVNGQAPDFGRQYRSMILFQNEMEETIAKSYKDSLDKSGTYKEPIATEIVALEKFWKAEDYHQDYEKNNPNQPYVRSVSIPRLNRFKEKFPELLKEESH
ncbi:MAG: peptide-methionine (S)-S-oxide reductase MsrA [Cytophagales bacterium]